MRRSFVLLIVSVALPTVLTAQEIRSVSCDGRSCPATLELEDGRTRTVELSGVDLDRIAGVQVVRDGAPVTGVDVQLGLVSGRTGSRTVTLTARDASLLDGLELRVTSDRGRDLGLPVQIMMRTAPPALPDLTVTTCEFTPANPTEENSVTLRMEWANVGAATAVLPSGHAVWMSSSQPAGLGSATSYPGVSNEVAPGESRSSQSTVYHSMEMPAGTYEVAVEVDPSGFVDESDESNNVLVCPLTIAPRPQADLVVEACSFVPSRPTVADTIRIHGRLRNAGNLLTTTSSGWKLYRPEGGGSGQTHPTIFQPGEAKDVALVAVLPHSRDAGSYVYSLKVDPDLAAEESDESNNQIECPLTIDPAPERQKIQSTSDRQ